MTYLRRPMSIPPKSCGHCTHWRLVSEVRDWSKDVGFCWMHKTDKIRREVCRSFEREPGSDDNLD